MAARSIRLPDVGEGVAEAEIVEWSVKPGDLVREDQVVAAVMTDKATVEIPTPFAGKVLALGGAVGDVLAVGSELIRIETGGESDRAEEAQAPSSSGMPAPRAPQDEGAGGAGRIDVEAPAAATAAKAPHAEERRSAPRIEARGAGEARAHLEAGAGRPAARAAGERPLASPAVRLRAREAGVDLRRVRGSGPAGRISHDDLDAFLAAPEAPPAPAGRRAPDERVETIKVVGLRRRIAEAMAESKRRVAHFSYVEELDVTALEELRAGLNANASAERPKLTLLPFLMQALVKAVADFPQINAHFDDEAGLIHRYGAVHIGVAAQTPGGLMVPVVRHAETLSLYDYARELRRVSEAARIGVATREELTGSTITLTSLGALGGVVSTPIVNRPEVAIVGVNRIVVRPVWRDGGFVPRKTMNLSSSFDHRVVDGFDAASFIQRMRALIEAPASLFIEG